MNSPWLDLRQGDALTVLKTLAAESVNCCVTSPPYWGLRDYGVEPVIWGGNPTCSHKWETELWRDSRKNDDTAGAKQRSNQGSEGWRNDWRTDTLCERCPAWRGSLGLERTPEAYVFHLVSVLREVRRVLRADGTLWLNLGDSYAGARSYQVPDNKHRDVGNRRGMTASRRRDNAPVPRSDMLIPGCKPKDLVGIPWLVAFALRDDGWYLRSEIIWSKPNPMPESVIDRPTKAHETLFLLSKAERYFYDAEAVMEPNASPEQLAHNLKYAKTYETYDARAATTGQPGNVGIHSRPARGSKRRTVRPGIDTHGGSQGNGHMEWNLAGRNRRSVWTIPTHPYPDAHFATFPPDLIKPCILAGCPEGGLVLDPFVGSGTTCLVANQLGRRSIGIDLNPAYVDLALERCAQATIWEAANRGLVAYDTPPVETGTRS